MVVCTGQSNRLATENEALEKEQTSVEHETVEIENSPAMRRDAQRARNQESQQEIERQSQVLQILAGADLQRLDLGLTGLYLESPQAAALEARLKTVKTLKSLERDEQRLALTWR